MKPFVSKPACRPAVSGIAYHKGFIAMGRYAALVSDNLDSLDPVQQSFAGRPELYFIDQSKELHPFAVVAFRRLFI